MYQPPRWYVPAANPCQVVLGCRAMPTRCKYIPVSSRFSSLKTDGRHNPAPSPPITPQRLEVKPSATRSFRRWVGTPLMRPFDVRDDINEPTGTYSRRVAAGAYQRRGRHEACSINNAATSGRVRQSKQGTPQGVKMSVLLKPEHPYPHV